MGRHISLALALVALALLIFGGPWAMGVGAVENATDENASADDPGEVVTFNDDVQLVDYDLEDGWAEFTFESEIRTHAVIYDSMAGIGQAGAVQVPKEEFLLEPGTQTVGMEATEFQGGYSLSVNVDGAAVRVSTEMDDTAGEDPFQYFGGESGLFTGMGLSVLSAAGAAIFVVKREDSGVIKA